MDIAFCQPCFRTVTFRYLPWMIAALLMSPAYVGGTTCPEAVASRDALIENMIKDGCIPENGCTVSGYSKSNYIEGVGNELAFGFVSTGNPPVRVSACLSPNLPTQSNPTNEVGFNQCGSVINVDEMSLGEQVPITGTPFDLVYSSERVPGNLNNNRLHIPLSGFDGAISTKLGITYLNRGFAYQGTLGAYDFIWDGRNDVGQEVFGPIRVTVGITPFYTLCAVCGPSEGPTITSYHSLGSFDARRYGLGGWSLSPLHYLHTFSAGGIGNIPAHQLYRGDGSVRTVTPQPMTATTGEAWRVVDHDAGVIYTFDAQGRHLFTRHELTNAVLYRFTYTATGKIATVADSFGNTTTIVRDASEAITGIRSPYGQVTSITRNANGWISRISNPAGENHDMTYVDAKGLLKTFRKPGGQLATFTYDARGRLIKDSNSAGNSLALAQTAEFDLNRSFKTTTAAGRIATQDSTVIPNTIYSIRRKEAIPEFKSTTTDEAGDITSRRYRPNLDFQLQAGDFNYSEYYIADSRFTHVNPWYMDGAFLTNNVNVSQGGNSLNASYQYTVDNTATTPTPFNYNTLTTEATVTGKLSKAVYTRTTGESVITSAQGRTSKLITDNVGRIKQAGFAALAPVQYSYDTRGRLTSVQQGLRLSTLTYDAKGWVNKLTDVLDHSYTYAYDPVGRVTSLTLPDLRVIHFSYDANGNMTEVSPPGRPSHFFEHNGFDLPSVYTPPLLSTVPNSTTHYTYNNDQQITRIDRPNGQAILFNYALGSAELASIGTPGGTYQFSFDAGHTTQAITPNNFTSTFTWAGELFTGEAITNEAGASLGSISATYDNDFRPVNLAVIDSSTARHAVVFGYDKDDLLIKAGAMTLSRAAATGFLTKTTLGLVSDTFGYNASYGELAGHTALVSGSAKFAETLTRDLAGRIIKKSETVQGVTKVYDYAYDSAGRLINATVNGAAYSNYLYDANSNRIGGSQGGGAITA